MATAQVQQVMEAPVHDDTNSCVREEEKNHEMTQDPPCTEAGERASDVKVHESDKDIQGKDELVEVPTTDTDDGQRIAQEVQAKLAVHDAVHPSETEAAKDPKEGRLGRGAKKPEIKTAAKGAIVSVDDDEVPAPGGAKKKAEKAAAKWAVVPVDDETDDEVVAPAGDQDPVAAPVAPGEAAEAAGEEATDGGKEDARKEEKAHEE